MMNILERKTYSLLLVATIGLFFSSCSKIDELTKFDVDYDSSVSVPSSTVVDFPISLTTPDIETNSESHFENNNTRKDLVEEINLKSIKLNITSPSDGDFGFLKTISVYLKADGLDPILIAWKNDIPADIGNELDLDTSGENLKEYLVKDSFSLSVKTTTDETIKQQQDIDVKSVFHVDAKILGI